MTSLRDYLTKKRQERGRGKLAGLSSEIYELKELGASYKEIAEYLQEAHGIVVSRSGLQQHLLAKAGRRANDPTPDMRVAAPGPSAQPSTQLLPAPLEQTLGNATHPSELFVQGCQNDGSKMPAADESSPEYEVTRYRLSSPEHKEMMERYRQLKGKSPT